MIGSHFGLYCAGLALVMDDGTGTVRDCTMRGLETSLFVLTRGIGLRDFLSKREGLY